MGYMNLQLVKKHRTTILVVIVLLVCALCLSGCGVTKVLSYNNYFGERMLRGKVGALLIVLCGAVGGVLAFTTSSGSSTEEAQKKKIVGVSLIVFAVWLGIMRLYYDFHYQGRRKHYCVGEYECAELEKQNARQGRGDDEEEYVEE